MAAVARSRSRADDLTFGRIGASCIWYQLCAENIRDRNCRIEPVPGYGTTECIRYSEERSIKSKVK